MPIEMNKRILFVDDDENILNGINRLLQNHFDITVASDGYKGLELIHNSPTYAVIVSDLRMDYMDGLTFLRKAHAISPESSLPTFRNSSSMAPKPSSSQRAFGSDCRSVLKP